MVTERLKLIAKNQNADLSYWAHHSDTLLRILVEYLESGAKGVTEESFGKPNWAYYRAYVDGWNARNKSIIDTLEGIMKRPSS